MIEKEFKYSRQQQYVLVHFTLPSSYLADFIHVVGDFNDWDRTSHPLWRDRKGRWTATVLLKPKRAYRFRYLVDRKQWLNDSGADAFVHNPGGISSSVLITDPHFRDYGNKMFERHEWRTGYGAARVQEMETPLQA